MMRTIKYEINIHIILFYTTLLLNLIKSKGFENNVTFDFIVFEADNGLFPIILVLN